MHWDALSQTNQQAKGTGDVSVSFLVPWRFLCVLVILIGFLDGLEMILFSSRQPSKSLL